MTESTTSGELEQKWEQSMNLKNELEIKIDDSNTTFYIGWAWLKFKGLDLWGTAKLSRVDRTKKMQERKKLISIIPWRYQRTQEPIEEHITRWEIISDDHSCFLYDGKLKTDYESGHYRASLRGRALNSGISLSPEIFDRVFGSIDAQVMQIYKRAKRFAGEAR